MNSEGGGERITLASANVSVSASSPVAGVTSVSMAGVSSVSMAGISSVTNTATITGSSGVNAGTVMLNRVITVRHTNQGVRDISSLHGHSVVSQNLTNSPHITLVDDDGDLDDDDDVEMEDDSYDEEMLGVGEDVTNQLAAAGWQNGPVGVAAAAAIASARRKQRRNRHQFETNPSVRKRQTTRITRKLRSLIDEFSLRVGQQAVVLIATPGKTVNNYKVFGAKPLEDVVRNMKSVIMSELETALSQQAPNPGPEDPSLHELPPVCVDGIPTPVEKMTQAQLRAFIPLMLKYSTGRGKPGWGKDCTRPPWWPKHVPWANVRMDARNDEQKSKSVSWTHALRDIVINCYTYHGRQDLLPKFSEEEESVTKAPSKKLTSWSGVVQTIANPDGTVSIVHVDPNNPVITLPDGTQAQIQLHDGAGVHTLAEVATSDGGSSANGSNHQDVHSVQPEQQHFLITGEDGNAYPVQVSGHQLVTVPVSSTNAMYQTVVAANLHSGENQVQVIGHPIQLGGVNGPVILKQEPMDPKTLSMDPESVTSAHGQISVLQLKDEGMHNSPDDDGGTQTSSAPANNNSVGESAT